MLVALRKWSWQVVNPMMEVPMRWGTVTRRSAIDGKRSPVLKAQLHANALLSDEEQGSAVPIERAAEQ